MREDGKVIYRFEKGRMNSVNIYRENVHVGEIYQYIHCDYKPTMKCWVASISGRDPIRRQYLSEVKEALNKCAEDGRMMT